MHKIDLLKGEGIPASTTTGGVIVLAMTAIVPVLVAAGAMVWYSQTKINISITSQGIINAKETISLHKPDLKQKKSLDQKIALLESQLSEVSRCIDTFIQWTPILVTLSENMPSRMIMTKLTSKSTGIRRTTRRRRSGDPNKPAIIPVPERTMVINLSGSGAGSYDSTVQGYQERLNLSPALKLKDIVPSKEAGTTDNGGAESYVMNIIFASNRNE